MLKNYIKLLLSLLILPFLASCSWEDLPAYEEADITGVQFRYRWASSDKDPITGEPIVKEIQLTTRASINADAGTIEATVTVPNASGNFPADARAACSAEKLWAQVTLSTAARLTPIDGAPAMGTPGDWTKPNTFRVTAADGTTKDWIIKIVQFNK